jgi:hypothetical protein
MTHGISFVNTRDDYSFILRASPKGATIHVKKPALKRLRVFTATVFAGWARKCLSA